jgi:hypothetical protein
VSDEIECPSGQAGIARADEFQSASVVIGYIRLYTDRGDREARDGQRAGQQADASAPREHDRIIVHLAAVGLAPDPPGQNLEAKPAEIEVTIARFRVPTA